MQRCIKEKKIEHWNRPEEEKIIFRMPAVQTLRVPLKILLPRSTSPLSSSLILAYSFAALIIIGTVLLIFPISSASGQYTSPVNALFTATSAVCLTGLVVVDTGTYWSTFGQGILFALIQIGGIGFIVGATLLLFAIGGKFGLRDRLVISETLGIDQIGGVLNLVWKVALFTLVLEGIGVAAFYFRWLSLGDPSVSLWTAIFHAASSFNNCGMDLFVEVTVLPGIKMT